MNKLKEKTITIREVHRNLSEIAECVLMGRTFLVTKNGEPVFRIQPVAQAPKKYTREDFKNIQFKGDPEMSQTIDEIVYGI